MPIPPSAHIAAVDLAAKVGTSGLTEWIRKNLVGLVVLCIGLVLIVISRQRQHGVMMEVVGGLLIGLVIVGLSFGNAAAEVGKFFTDLVVSK